MEPPTHLPAPEPDPFHALLRRYGVRDMDLRRHGTMSPDQLEGLLEAVIRSVLPPLQPLRPAHPAPPASSIGGGLMSDLPSNLPSKEA